MADLNEAPFEIMYGPCEVHVNANVDADPPNLGAVVPPGTLDGLPDLGWVQLGATGTLDNMPEDGLTFALGSTIETWTPIGRTLPIKARRSAQEIHVRFSLADFTVETIALFCDDDGDLVVDDPAGLTDAGTRTVRLEMTPWVTEYAVLVRFNHSPYGLVGPNGANWRSQIYLPRAVNAGAPEPVFAKSGSPALIAWDYQAMSDTRCTNKAQFSAVDSGQTAP